MDRVLQQVPVPVHLAGMSYQKLFSHMVRHEASVPLGIFGKRGNSERVVVTNPPPTLEVSASDMLYVVVAPVAASARMAEAATQGGIVAGRPLQLREINSEARLRNVNTSTARIE